jgi:malonyl-CoA/methylmalonyl-CoA synthetase
MIEPWGWSNKDQILHILPLHHTHGIVNCLLCPLQVGASIDMLDGFDPKVVIDKLVAGDVNVFMAVPTVYAKLLEYIRKGMTKYFLTFPVVEIPIISLTFFYLLYMVYGV